MSPRTELPSQPAAPASAARTPAAGCWKLAAGQALSLRPRTRATLQVAQGQVWLTVGGSLAERSGTTADHVLRAGDQLAIAPGQHVVMEAWCPSNPAGDAAFRWDHAEAPVPARHRASAACDWECGVLHPLRELGAALGAGGRALGGALVDAADAGGRLAAGLARFAVHRIAAPQRRTHA
ncbi:DUF2917 domain-containing protein [Acidovorax sp. BL-A-41-H1]|uniref:DUF2917 domain-containing protein n=1 Tax=Acidovorax sp. BL-A-41-H1 TaxID=3421102 RepID=UPI003F795995